MCLGQHAIAHTIHNHDNVILHSSKVVVYLKKKNTAQIEEEDNAQYPYTEQFRTCSAL